jgi:hypothetical protein
MSLKMPFLADFETPDNSPSSLKAFPVSVIMIVWNRADESRKMQTLSRKIQRGLNNYWQLYAMGNMPIAVFCTGRVGSMSLFFTLEELGYFTFKIEHLANAKLRRNFGNSQWFYEHILQAKRNTKIISFFRDPIALMVSDFFNKLHWISGSPNAWESHSQDELARLFNQKYFAEKRHIEHLQWWDKEFNAALGFDVYQQDSPRETGWVHFKEGQFDVLILKTELDDSEKSAQLSRFVARENIKIKRTNIGDEKIFGEAYKRFKAELHVDAQHLDTAYNSAYARHFFSDAELSKLYEKWA